MFVDRLGRPMGDDAIRARDAAEKKQDRWSDALSIMNSVSSNPDRAGQHLDIRLVGPSCSITLLSLDDLRELIARARK